MGQKPHPEIRNAPAVSAHEPALSANEPGVNANEPASYLSVYLEHTELLYLVRRYVTYVPSTVNFHRAAPSVGVVTVYSYNLKIREKLIDELCDLIVKKTQVEAAAFLGVSQPRISALKHGKVGLFTIDALVNMLAHAGVRVRVSLSR